VGEGRPRLGGRRSCACPAPARPDRATRIHYVKVPASTIPTISLLVMRRHPLDPPAASPYNFSVKNNLSTPRACGGARSRRGALVRVQKLAVRPAPRGRVRRRALCFVWKTRLVCCIRAPPLAGV